MDMMCCCVARLDVEWVHRNMCDDGWVQTGSDIGFWVLRQTIIIQLLFVSRLFRMSCILTSFSYVAARSPANTPGWLEVGYGVRC